MNHLIRFILLKCLFSLAIGINDEYTVPSNCTTTASIVQFFNPASMLCQSCGQNSTVQERATDGLSCKCKAGYRIVTNYGGNKLTCTPCPSQQVASLDGYSCVSCPATAVYNTETKTCNSCPSGQVKTDRNVDGTLNSARECVLCNNSYSQASSSGLTCEACSANFAIPGSSCTCSASVYGGICFATTLTSYNTEVAPTSEVSGVSNVVSDYYSSNLASAAEMCSTTYNNVTACEVLSNLCAGILYSQVVKTPLDACGVHLKYLPKDSAPNFNTQNIPWIFYRGTSVDSVLKDTTITYQLTHGESLPFLAGQFTLNGTYLGYSALTNGLLQLCKGTASWMDAAYIAGTVYSQQCEINVDDLFSNEKYPLRFYDLYLKYTSTDGKVYVYAIPIKIQNAISSSSSTPNTQSDSTNWILTRRFFLVDNVLATASGSVEFVRYASSLKLTIVPQLSTDKDGLIYPPYLTVQYSTVTKSQLGQGDTVSVAFSVTYEADQTSFQNKLSIAMGTMAALATLWAFLKTWSWSRRSGSINVDIVLVVKLFAFAAGSLANVFLVVIFGICFYYLVFYKNQQYFSVFLPTSSQETFLIAYICVAGGLKALEVLHMIISQCTVDIFFIDWERPKTTGSQNGKRVEEDPLRDTTTQGGDDTTKAAASKPTKKDNDDQVSIWRTYFCCNEWNEIQTYRKTWPLVTTFVVLLFMEVIGFSNVVSADTNGVVSSTYTGYRSADSRMFRIAVIVAIFIITGIVQWIFSLLIYERLIEDKLRNYVDLCSVANVSVFVMSQRQFGYYIHGQSVNCSADVGLKAMYDQMQRENDGVVPQRGLEKNTDQQTYMMALPTKMRTQFDRLYAPFAEGRNVQKGLETYRALNRFLSQFIYQSDTENMRYTCKDRGLLEDILDFEFTDAKDGGLFYRDNGNSFGNILFYGNEFTLFTFDILVFCIMDIIYGNTVLDAIILWIVQWLVTSFRDSFGSKNLARKTLVDDRFLI